MNNYDKENGTYMTSAGNVIMQFETHDITEPDQPLTREEIIEQFVDNVFTDTKEFIENLYGADGEESLEKAKAEYLKWNPRDAFMVGYQQNYSLPLRKAIIYDTCYNPIFEEDFKRLAEQLKNAGFEDTFKNEMECDVVNCIFERIVNYLEKETEGIEHTEPDIDEER